jgi:hypothetical protein
VLGAAVLAPNATAVPQRYASPSGAGTACTSAAPCTITRAIKHATAGDEVIVEPGTYHLTEMLGTPPQTSIHGVAGKPRPRLVFTGGGMTGMFLNAGSTLRYVELDQTVADRHALYAYEATVDQVIAKASYWYGTVYIQGTMRNSVVLSSGANGRALMTDASGSVNEATYRNVTAVATGSGGVAIDAVGGQARNVTIHAINTIAQGGPGGADLQARTDSSGARATIEATHASYAVMSTSGTHAEIVDVGGNQHLAPLFTDPAAGDYRQRAGSPTIGAGADSAANGTLDFEGDARAIGATDIGADEAPAPPAPVPATPAAPGPSPAPGFAGVALSSTRLTLTRGFVTLRLSCPAETAGPCSGSTRLTAAARRSAARVRLGRASFSIAPGKQARVRVRVSRAGRRLVSRKRRLSARARNVAHDAAGVSRTTVAAVTIRKATTKEK